MPQSDPTPSAPPTTTTQYQPLCDPSSTVAGGGAVRCCSPHQQPQRTESDGWRQTVRWRGGASLLKDYSSFFLFFFNFVCLDFAHPFCQRFDSLTTPLNVSDRCAQSFWMEFRD